MWKEGEKCEACWLNIVHPDIDKMVRNYSHARPSLMADLTLRLTSSRPEVMEAKNTNRNAKYSDNW